MKLPIYIREQLTMSQLNYSSKGFLELIGVKLKFMEIRMKQIKLPHINFLSCVMISFKKNNKKEKKLNIYKALQ